MAINPTEVRPNDGGDVTTVGSKTYTFIASWLLIILLLVAASKTRIGYVVIYYSLLLLILLILVTEYKVIAPLLSNPMTIAELNA